MLVEAIEFPVFVAGKPLTASVVEVNENPVQHSFAIQFSDGYADIFTLDEGVIEADKGDSSLPYLKAIRTDIPQVIGLDTNKFYHVFPDMIDGVATNIWIIEKEDLDNTTYYGVYYNEYYRFELRSSNDAWVWSTRSHAPGATIPEALAKKVSQLLYSLL